MMNCNISSSTAATAYLPPPTWEQRQQLASSSSWTIALHKMSLLSKLVPPSPLNVIMRPLQKQSPQTALLFILSIPTSCSRLQNAVREGGGGDVGGFLAALVE